MPTNYTFDELYGAGTSSIDLINNASYIFTITNNSGSSYFVMETPFNYQFNGSTPKNTSGSFSSLTNIASSNITNYVAGFVLPKGTNSFVFTPFTDVSGPTLKLRGTGGITLSIGDAAFVSGSWILISQPWNEVTSSWEQPIV